MRADARTPRTRTIGLLSKTALTAALAVALAAATASAPALASPAGLDGSSGAQRTNVAAPRAAATGTVTAHDGAFWLGTKQILLHGIGVGGLSGKDWDEVASFNFNEVRTHVQWALLEPTAPTKNTDGTWKHTYDTTYLQHIVAGINAASNRGMYMLVNAAICDDTSSEDTACSPVGWPSWMFKSAYNSHGKTYDLTSDDGKNLAEGDFWVDNEMIQHMSDMWSWLAKQLSPVPGVLGYEIMNEPHKGYWDASHATTQLLLDDQVKIAKAIRASDSKRVIFFATRAGSGLGLPNADLSGMLSVGNVAFDLHNYFGARWGGGLSTGLNSAGETKQDQYNSTFSGIPYFGTTLGQIRMVQTYLNVLRPVGIPLYIGEFGDANADPGVMNYFGTTTSAFNQLNVSWNIHNNIYATGQPGDWSLLYKDGSETPWLSQIIKPAALYQP